MKYLISSILLLFVFLNSEAINVLEAIKTNKINLDIENLGSYSGESTQILIHNISKTKIDIVSDESFILEGSDTMSQNLISASDFIVKLNPNQSKTIRISTFCISPKKGSPFKGEKYFIKRMPDFYLSQLIKFIKSNKIANDLAQNTIWACQNGSKHLYYENKNDAKFINLKNLYATIYDSKLKNNLILEDTSLYHETKSFYTLNANYDLYIKSKKKYTIVLKDSVHNIVRTFFDNKELEIGFFPIRLMHHYAATKENKFYIEIKSDNQIIEKNEIINNTKPYQYTKESLKNNTVFFIKESMTASLYLKDSINNIYNTFYTNRLLPSGITPFNYSYTIYKPKNRSMFLVLEDQSGKVIKTIKASNSSNLKAINGYFYVRLNQATDAIFGLYNDKNELIEEFKNERFKKGLQMLPYGFLFDTKSKNDVFLKIIDKKTGTIFQSEKVFIK